MLVAGLTGGIGSGKSTFASFLIERGAEVVDADELGRDALRAGEPGWHRVIGQFGDEILVPGTKEIDRQLLAEIVFSESQKLAALNAIVHPVIFEGIAERLEMLRGTDEIVVLDAALILETGLRNICDVLIAVVADEDARAARVEQDRGMPRADFLARAAAEVPRERLIEAADIIVHNDGDLEHLAEEAERVWEELQKRA